MGANKICEKKNKKTGEKLKIRESRDSIGHFQFCAQSRQPPRRDSRRISEGVAGVVSNEYYIIRGSFDHFTTGWQKCPGKGKRGEGPKEGREAGRRGNEQRSSRWNAPNARMRISTFLRDTTRQQLGAFRRSERACTREKCAYVAAAAPLKIAIPASRHFEFFYERSDAAG